MKLLRTLVTLAAGLTITLPAFAQVQADATIGADNLDLPWSQLGASYQTDRGHQLGAGIRGGFARERFIAGGRTTDATVITGTVNADWALDQRRAQFVPGTGLSLQSVHSRTPTTAGQTNLVPGLSLTSRVRVGLGPRATLEFAVPMNFALAVSPTVEVDILESPMSVALDVWLSPRVALVPSASVGGAFGYGGDGAKHRLGGSLSLKVALSDRSIRKTGYDPAAQTAGFVHLGWRTLGLGGHISHGPEFAAGARLMGGWLKLGIAGFNRPGPLNPKTFRVPTSNGEDYKGSDVLTLRSDGAVVGLLVGTQIPLTSWLAVDVPVIIGQAGFGFYLAGTDRETPDGRRVSEWENELQDSRDSSFSLAVDVGLRAKLSLASVPWLKPTIGAHYTATPGFGAYVTDDYSGFSGSVGLEVVAF